MNTRENETAENDHTPTPEPVERRRWPRFPDPNHSAIWYSTPTRGAQSGQVTEISAGGFAMSAVDVEELEVGQRVVVGYENWMIPAIVKT